MTIQKQDLIDFIQNFGGENITKQDILDFIERSKETKVTIEFADFQVNDGVKKFWGDEDDLRELLDDVNFANKVTVNFEDKPNAEINRQEVLTAIEYFIDEGYNLTYVDVDCVKFEKN